MTEELKPCPFCGKTPKLYKSEYEEIEPFGIVCGECAIVFLGATEKEVIEHWNRRK